MNICRVQLSLAAAVKASIAIVDVRRRRSSGGGGGRRGPLFGRRGRREGAEKLVDRGRRKRQPAPIILEVVEGVMPLQLLPELRPRHDPVRKNIRKISKAATSPRLS